MNSKFITICLAVLFATGCDISVAPYQIEACAKACALGHKPMLRCTDKECACGEAQDGGAP